MKNRRTSKALLLAAAALLAPQAGAQTYTTLIEFGDVVTNGASTVGLVSYIANVDVNGSGSYLLDVSTDNPDQNLNEVIIQDGVVIWQEGDTVPCVSGGVWESWNDSMDINDNGDVLLLMNVDVPPAGGFDDIKVALWNGIPILEEGVTVVTLPTLPPGTTFTYINEVWQNNSNQIVVHCLLSHSTSDQMLLLVDHDGLGTITNFSVLRSEGEVLPGHVTAVDYVADQKTNLSLNDNGDTLYPVDDSHNPPGSTVNDCSLWISNTEIAPMREGMTAFWPGLDYWTDYYQSFEFDLNLGGDWVANVPLNGTWVDFALISYNQASGTYTRINRSGDPAPGFTGGEVTTRFYQNHIGNSGDIMWSCDTDGLDTEDRALYYNSAIVLREGHTLIGTNLVETIESGGDANAMSNSGIYIIQGVSLASVGSAVVLLQLTPPSTAFCLGDGSDGVTCPCGNIPALGSGEGCTNGSGLGAYIVAGGAASVSADSLNLTVMQATPNEIGIFVQNISTSAPFPFYNGALCLTTDSHLVRHYAPPVILPTSTDATGMGSNAQPMTVGDFLGDTQPGVTLHYQFWGRDTASCGNGANFSSGVSLTWTP